MRSRESRQELIKAGIIDALTTDHLGGNSRYLAPIANQPLISHVVDAMAQCGVERIAVLVRGEWRDALCEALRSAPGPVEVDVITGDPDDSTSPLRTVREAIGDSPTVFHSGDCLFPADIARLQECFYADALDLAVLVNNTREGGRQPLELVPRTHVRLPRQQPQGTAIIFGDAVWPVVESLETVHLSVPQLIAAVTAGGCRVGACEVGEHWCYSDCTDRLLAANRMLLDALPFDRCRSLLGTDNNTEGRISVSPSAHVSRSTLRGPVVIGENALVEDSFIGPYTAIGDGATVVGAELDYTMVLSDAEVRHPGYRLEASVIGERAVVRHSFGLPAGMHLRIGPDAQVTLG